MNSPVVTETVVDGVRIRQEREVGINYHSLKTQTWSPPGMAAHISVNGNVTVLELRRRKKKRP